MSAAAPGAPRTFFGEREIPRSEKAPRVRALFDGVAARYDLMNDLMSGGIHRLWKDALVDWLNPAPPLAMADICGGTGDIAMRVWRRVTRGGRDPGASRIAVVDSSPVMVEHGRDRALDRGIAGGIDFAVGDAEALPLSDSSQDACTIAFGIRNVTDMAAALGEARRVLRFGGRFLCLEFGGPVAPGLDAAYDAYSRTVLPALGAAVANDRGAYEYLVESIRRFPDRESFAGMIEDAGLGRVRVRVLAGGIATLYSAWRI